MPFFPQTWWSNLVTMLTVTCVPLFLMVNGALLLNRSFDWQKWRVRLIRFAALTVFWKLLLVLFCSIFWSAGGDNSPSAVIGYLLGGEAPYPQIGYTWFLDMFIGVQLLFPIIKYLYDLEEKRYLWLLMAVICVFPVGGETLFMIVQPIADYTGRGWLATSFLNLVSYAPLTLNSVYLAYFSLGGLLYARFGQLDGGDDKERLAGERRALFIAGIICFVLLYMVNRFQVHHIGQMFDIAQKYTNLFSIVLCSALFVAVLIPRYGKCISVLASFVGRRTFGIFILEVVPIRCLDILVGGGALSGTMIPNGSSMPGPLAMAYLLSLVVLSVLATAAGISLVERVPIVRRLFP